MIDAFTKGVEYGAVFAGFFAAIYGIFAVIIVIASLISFGKAGLHFGQRIITTVRFRWREKSKGGEKP